MEILKETDTEMEILFKNEKPTFLMIVKEELDKMPEVLIAAWREDHPLTKDIYFYVKTDGSKKPREVILEAIQRAIKRVEDFSDSFKKVLK
ncbi:MAG TPA: hypothetical protein EYH22_03350 [Candidatus Nanopusillus sp.]|nr:hypothetical protein [Candidatus Nanopusillus sp.]